MLNPWQIITLIFVTLLAPILFAQSTTIGPITVDATSLYLDPAPSSFQPGSARSPDGHTIGLNQRYLTLDGKPWLPVMGEFHFSRVPADEWEDQILKMRAAGVNIIATYVIWIHHEEVEGKFNWTGDRDLHRFAQLCSKHHMYLYVRVGPWAHGEARNGGFPDWLVAKGPTRVNDPTYLKHVTGFYGAIGQQLHDLLWKDGGPVIGIQLENEYANRTANGGEAHILKLKQLAIASGLDVPLYSVTGWDNAAIPSGAVLPVFGGYPDAPWDASPGNLSASEVYTFRFGSRVAGNMGMIGGSATAHTTSTDTPFITAEMGAGIEDTYHRRPVISANDVAAMFPVMLGSGVNLYGTYMFQGGENPNGEFSTLQESQATGYPTDVPTKSYDFQAPLGEFGEERESLRKLKLVNYFLNDFGDQLAPMIPHPPSKLPKTPADLSVPRLSIRSSGERGFVFVNNYVRGAVMPSRPSFQLKISLPDSTLLLPEQPVDLPTGSYFVWPFNLQLGDAHLRYSTAQLFTRLSNPTGSTFVFFCLSGIRCEFSFVDQPGMTIHGTHGRVLRANGVITATDLPPALDTTLSLRFEGRSPAQILILSQQHAEDAWKLRLKGEEHLVITKQQFFASDSQVTLQSDKDPAFQFTVIPASPAWPFPATKTTVRQQSNGTTTVSAHLPVAHPTLVLTPIKQAGTAAAVKIGPPPSWRPQGVPQAPEEDTFDAAAAVWKLSLANASLSNLGNLYLRVDYVGDIARLSNGHHLLVDNFFNGDPWKIGLKRFVNRNQTGDLLLQILPLRGDSPVFLEDRIRKTIPTTGQTEQLRSVQLIPQYNLTLPTTHD